MNLGDVLKLGRWSPIRDCPGRYILRGEPATLTLEELLGFRPELLRFPPTGTRDGVLIVLLEDGALLSYERADGSFLHTLNTQEGLDRKLKLLGIRLEETGPRAGALPP